MSCSPAGRGMLARVVALTMAMLACSPSTTDGQPVEGDIDRYVQSVMAANEIPGLSLAVVRNGRPFMVKGYGVSNMNTSEPVTNETLFYIASATKAFTATLLSQMFVNHSR